MLLQQKKYKFKKVMKRNLTQNNFKYNALLQFGNVGLITIRSKPISSEIIETVRQAMQKKLTKLNTSFLSKKSFLKHRTKGIKISSGISAELKVSHMLFLYKILIGSFIHNVFTLLNKKTSINRTAGTYSTLLEKINSYGTLYNKEKLTKYLLAESKDNKGPLYNVEKKIWEKKSLSSIALIDYMDEYYDLDINPLKIITDNNDLYLFYERKKKFYFEKAVLIDKSFLRINNSTSNVDLFDAGFIFNSEINLIKAWEIPDQKNLIDLKNYLECNKPQNFSKIFSFEFERQMELINLLIKTNTKESFFIDNEKLFRRSLHRTNIKNLDYLNSKKSNLQSLSKEIQTFFPEGLYFDFNLLDCEFDTIADYLEKQDIETQIKINSMISKDKTLQKSLFNKLTVYSNIDLKSLRFLKGFSK